MESLGLKLALCLLKKAVASYILKRKISVLQCMSVWFSRQISTKNLPEVYAHTQYVSIKSSIYQTLLSILSTVEHVHKYVIPSTIQMPIIGGEYDTYRYIDLLLKILGKHCFIDTHPLSKLWYFSSSIMLMYTELLSFLQICLVLLRYHLTQYQPRSSDYKYWRSNFH